VAISGAGETFSTPEQLAMLLDRLVTDPAHRGRLAANSIKAVREHWAESVVVPRFLALVTEAAERRTRTHASS